MEAKNKNIVILVVVVLITNIITFAITSSSKSSVAGVLSESKTSEVLATTNKSEITSDSTYEEMLEGYGVNTVVNIADEQLLDVEYPKSSDEIKAATNQKWDGYIAMYSNQGQDFVKILETSGITEQEWKDRLAQEAQEEALTEAYIIKGLTDDKLKKEYDSLSNEYQTKHILFKVNNSSEDAASKAEAEKVLSELEATGDVAGNFDDFANDYSDDTGTATNGGKFNFRAGEAVEEYEKTAMKLNPGEYEIAKTQYGYHIIYKVGEEEKKPFEEMKNTLINDIVEETIQEDKAITNKAKLDLRERYDFKFNDTKLAEDYEKIVESLKKS